MEEREDEVGDVYHGQEEGDGADLVYAGTGDAAAVITRSDWVVHRNR